MIPRDYITAWRREAPWIEDLQVEQDLVISRALVEIFRQPILRESLAFRGGTALYKLHIKPPARYSEDIDLVQVKAEPAGPVMNALREVLDPWLGTPRYKQTEGRVTFVYRFASESSPPVPLRLKIEINTREHFAVKGFVDASFDVSSPWFREACDIKTYQLDELLATKLRALYQRRKGRDLFDLAVALRTKRPNADAIVEIFGAYIDHGGQPVSKTRFEENLAAKRNNPAFAADVPPLLSPDYEWNCESMADQVLDTLIAKLDR